MNYESAKTLKDAGFPQAGESWACWHNGEDKHIDLYGTPCVEGGGIVDVSKMDIVFIPTLNDLIVACGSGFTALINSYDDMWDAGELAVEDAFHDGFGRGKTPLEAVINLYINLKESGLLHNNSNKEGKQPN